MENETLRPKVLLLLLKICFLPVELLAQKEIKGIVKDETGNPVIGATVVEEGTTNGTVTDLDGEFDLKGIKKPFIMVSYIGYENQKVPIKDISNIVVLLKPETKTLNDVVVIGFGSMKRSDLTGSVASANLKDFSKEPNTNLIQSLQGTVPGLNVGQVASAGATPSISIRGTNTISGNSSVLIILDGIVFNQSLSSINPADIASIDVLKDASATAIYGAQAANGVILITTKKGKTGKAKINFSSSYTIQNPTRNLHPMNRSEMLAWDKKVCWHDAYTEASGYTEDNPNFNLASVMPDAYLVNSEGNIIDTDYDWFDAFTRQSTILDTNVSISGGTSDISYLISLANTGQKNYLLNDDFKRNSIRLNVEGQVRPWMKVGIQSFGSFINQDGQETYLPYLISMSPLASPYDSNGNLIDYPMYTARENPYHGSDVDDYERHNYFFANFYTEIKLPIKGLTYRLNFGNNYNINNHDYASQYANSNNGEAYKIHYEYYDYTLDNILSYNNTFGNHSINATFVYGAKREKYDYTDADATTFSNITLGYNSLELGGNQYTSSDAYKETSLYQIARMNYKYKDRYLVTGTIRRDGYSGFSKNNKFGVFPSMALGWIVSEEPFFKNVKWVDNLKIRTGYGVSGNQTSRYSSLSRVSSDIGYIFGDGTTGSVRQEISSLGNDNLKWERTSGLNFGVDFTCFHNRIIATLDSYITTTRDLLYSVSIPTITGYSSILSNIGKIRNKGIEFTITSRNIVSKNFEWLTTFNISSNNNKILALSGSGDLTTSNLFIGHSLSTIYDYKVNGIYQVGDKDIPDGYYPGDYRIVDVNGDGKITTADKTILGKTDPAYRFGILNKFHYKSFTLSFFINSVQGGKNGYLGRNSYSATYSDNDLRYNRISEEANLFWSPTHTNGIYSLAYTAGAITPYLYQKRNFIRLQDVTFNYDVPNHIINHIGIQELSVFFNIKNLLTITGWHGWDPEYTTSYTDDNGNTCYTGSTYDGRPVMRSFSIGFNVSF